MRYFLTGFLIGILTGCAAFKDNPILVHMTLKQGVARFIEASSNPARRAEKVDNALVLAKTAMQDVAGSTLDNAVSVINREVRASDLGEADKLLLEDIITIMKIEIRRVANIPEISEKDTVLELLTAARAVASRYLKKEGASAPPKATTQKNSYGIRLILPA